MDVETIAAIEGLRGDVIGLREDVDGLRANVSGLREDVDGLRANVGGLREEVDARFDRVDARLDRLEAQSATFATKQELANVRDELKRHTQVLNESVRDDIRILADGFATLSAKFDARFP